mgnify:CR=1 FL=1|jgi:hypothetical protein
MSDAISNLGGGGLSTPYLGNLANSLDYAASCLIALFGGPLINKFGIKWSCMIAAVTMPLTGSSYYVSAKYSVDWYLLFSKVRITHASLQGFSRPNNFIAARGIHFGLPLRR